MNERRNLLKRSAVIVGSLLCLQALGFFIYRTVESAKSAPIQAFSFERLTLASQGLDAELVTEGGARRRLRDGLGRPSLVHFWATWCEPCRTELPPLLEFARSQDVTLVLVSVDESWQVVRHFFDGAPPGEVVLDANAELRATFDVSTLPDTYLLDRDGRPLARFHGARDWSRAGKSRELSALLLEAARVPR